MADFAGFQAPVLGPADFTGFKPPKLAREETDPEERSVDFSMTELGMRVFSGAATEVANVGELVAQGSMRTIGLPISVPQHFGLEMERPSDPTVAGQPGANMPRPQLVGDFPDYGTLLSERVARWVGYLPADPKFDLGFEGGTPARPPSVDPGERTLADPTSPFMRIVEKTSGFAAASGVLGGLGGAAGLPTRLSMEIFYGGLSGAGTQLAAEAGQGTGVQVAAGIVPPLTAAGIGGVLRRVGIPIRTLAATIRDMSDEQLEAVLSAEFSSGFITRDEIARRIVRMDPETTIGMSQLEKEAKALADKIGEGLATRDAVRELAGEEFTPTSGQVFNSRPVLAAEQTATEAFPAIGAEVAGRQVQSEDSLVRALRRLNEQTDEDLMVLAPRERQRQALLMDSARRMVNRAEDRVRVGRADFDYLDQAAQNSLMADELTRIDDLLVTSRARVFFEQQAKNGINEAEMFTAPMSQRMTAQLAERQPAQALREGRHPLVNMLARNKQGDTLAAVLNLRSQILSEIRVIRKSAGASTRQRSQLGQLVESRKVIDDFLENPSWKGAARTDLIRDYKEFARDYRDLVQMFREGAAGRVRKIANSEVYDVTGLGRVHTEWFRPDRAPGIDAATAAQQFKEISRRSGSTVMTDALEASVMSDFHRLSRGTPKSTVNSMKAWRKTHRTALNQFPALRSKTDRALKQQQQLATAGARFNVIEKNVDKTITSSLLGRDPEQLVDTIFRSQRPEVVVAEILDNVGNDPAVLRALRRSILDRAIDGDAGRMSLLRSIENSESLNMPGVRRFNAKFTKVFQMLNSEQHLRNLDTIYNGAAMVSRQSPRSQASPLLKDVMRPTSQWWDLAKVTSRMRARAAGKVTLHVALAEAVSRILGQTSRRHNRQAMGLLIERSMWDPNLAQDLAQASVGAIDADRTIGYWLAQLGLEQLDREAGEAP